MRIFLIAILLIASLGPALPQVKKGPPEEILGAFGNSPTQCRSYKRKLDNIKIFTEKAYTWCATNHCVARIVSHRRVPEGFVLKLASGHSWEMTFRRISEGVYETSHQGIDAKEIISRCKETDMVAGIGLPTNFELEPDPHFPGLADMIKSPDGLFSAAYARTVPRFCPDLKVDQSQVDGFIQIGRLGNLKLLLERRDELPEGWTYERKADDEVNSAENDAGFAVEMDANQIRDFCNHVLDAFGPQGRVIANILHR